MTAAKSQGVKLLGKKKKNLNGYSAWVKQGKKGGNETVRYIGVTGVCRAGFHCSTTRNLATDLTLGTSG